MPNIVEKDLEKSERIPEAITAAMSASALVESWRSREIKSLSSKFNEEKW
jgi:hypothetical protein